MTPEVLAVIMFLTTLLFLLFGFPVAFTLAGSSLIFAFSLKTLIGRASFSVNDKGEVILNDKYDFNNLKQGFKDRFGKEMFYADDLDGANFLDYLKATYRIGGDAYRQFRNTAAFFGSNPGDESSMLKINLGILDEKYF